MPEYIFVYGTLKKSVNCLAHELLEQHCVYQSEAYLYGKLYDVGNYPGAIFSDNESSKVHGELYRVVNSDALFEGLDDYEECSNKFALPHEYQRIKIIVYDCNAQTFQAWSYLYNFPVANLKEIDSGNFIRQSS